MIQSVMAERTCEEYILDEWTDSRYTNKTISGDNFVTDHKIGLMCKQCLEGFSGVDCANDSATTHTWKKAQVLAETNNTIGFAGFSDWWLTNQKELRTYAVRNCYIPSINENVFPNTPSDWF